MLSHDVSRIVAVHDNKTRDADDAGQAGDDETVNICTKNEDDDVVF